PAVAAAIAFARLAPVVLVDAGAAQALAVADPAALLAIAAAVAFAHLVPVLLVDAGPPQTLAPAALVLRPLHHGLQIRRGMPQGAGRTGETGRRAASDTGADAGRQENRTHCRSHEHRSHEFLHGLPLGRSLSVTQAILRPANPGAPNI